MINEKLNERIERWKNSLIDLSLRNRLINFRETKRSTLKTLDPSLNTLFKFIVEKSKEMIIVPNETDQLNSKKKNSKKLRVNCAEDNCKLTLNNLKRRAKTSLEEQGVNISYLAFGLLKWYEVEYSETPRLAPLLLVPITLAKSGIDSDYTIKMIDDEILLNPSICKKFEEFGINLPSFEELQDLYEKEESNNTSFLDYTFKTLKEKISLKKRWEIVEEAWISLFSFSKLAMYTDLEKAKNEDFLMNNKIIRAITTGSYIDKDNEYNDLEAQKLDEIFTPKNTFQILDADSSQLEAIAAVNNGYNIVIEGPPGTGKSQTIANIIAESLARKKTVLFVSEKMAALDVVKKRLDENGLGDFVLELHSKKTGKRAVLDELNRVMKNIQKNSIPDMDIDLMNLEKYKNELNRYVSKLHKKQGNMNLSAYMIHGKLFKLRNIKEVNCSFNRVNEFTPEKYERIKDNLKMLKNYENLLHDSDNFELDKVKLKNFNYSTFRELKNSLEEQTEIIDKIEDSASRGACFNWDKIIDNWKTLCKNNNFTKKDYKKIPRKADNLIKFLEEHKKFFSNKLSTIFSDLIETSITLKNEITKYNEALKKLTTFHNDLLSIDFENCHRKLLSIFEKYKVNIFKLNTEKLLIKWKKYDVFFGKLYKGYIKNKLKRLSRNKNLSDNIIQDLETINYVKDNYKIEPGLLDEQAVLEKYKELKLWLSSLTKNRDLFEKRINKLNHLMEELESYLIASRYPKNEENENKESRLVELSNFITLNRALVNSLAKNESLIEYGLNFKNNRLKDIYSLKSFLQKITKALPNMEDWFQVKSIISDLRNDGGVDFFWKFLKTKQAFNHIIESFEKTFLLNYFDYLYNDEDLRKFKGSVFNEKINEFRKMDMKQREYSKYRIQNILFNNYPEIDIVQRKNNSEISKLKREIQKKRRNLPLRKLFLEIPNLLKTLKPCMMMSPLSISYFIDIKGLKFDLVIFDEASQVFPEDSIGAIMRSKQAVIVGDTKQLPPTSFFKTADLDIPEDEDAEDYLENLESILNECLATAMPSKSLKWHYRSRKESLIAFSNYKFYNNELYTFPDNQGNGNGINHIYVENGEYDRGKSRRNIKEAQKVAELIIQHAKEKPDVSLGVVALSEAQQNAIIDSIEMLRRKNKILESFFKENKLEPFFVKNLENVQGDERDEIILSIGYGKDYSGKLNMNFGPINKVGGERRLNVAITRSRKKITVVSSIRSDEMNVEGKNNGIRILKEYLKYAENNGNKASLISEIRENLGDFDSVFEKEVHNILKKKGYEVHKQVGCSGYRIDLGVVYPDKPGKYLAGIECDGATYHSAKTARDRDRLRQQILEDLGWNIIRIWSRDWFKNPKNEIDKLIEKLDSLKSNQGNSNNSVKTNIEKYTHVEVKKINKTEFDKEYRVYEKFDKHKFDAFLSKIPNPTSEELLLKILETESPMHIKELFRRFNELFKYIRLFCRGLLYSFDEIITKKKNLSFNGLDILLKRTINKHPEIYSIDNEFIHKKTINQYKPRKLSPGIKIKAEHIPPEDIQGFTKIVLRNSFGIGMNDLSKSVCELLGFKRLGETLKETINNQIHYMLREKEIYVKNDKYFLSN